MADNKLGDGSGAGENAVLSSQSWVKRMSEFNHWPTKQIAASLRNYTQLDLLAGTDVYTIPPKVAAAGHKSLTGIFTNRLGTHYDVPLNETAKNLGIEKFWEVPQSVIDLGRSLDRDIPATGEELVARVHEAGLGDMFPVLSEADNERIAIEGKIPVLSSWRDRIIPGSSHLTHCSHLQDLHRSLLISGSLMRGSGGL